MKQIVITEKEDGQITLEATKGVKWTTLITGIEMMIETILDNANARTNIDNILDDIKRIYERDKKNENN